MSEPQVNSQEPERIVNEVAKREDIPLNPNEFLLNTSQMDELTGVNPIVRNSNALSFYKVTGEVDNNKPVPAYEMTTIDVSKFTDSLLVYNPDFSKKMLGVVLGQIKNDINAAVAVKTFVDFKMATEDRLERSKAVMTNNCESARVLLKKLDELGITKGEEFESVVTELNNQIEGSQKLFVKGQEIGVKVTEENDGSKSFSINGEGQGQADLLKLKEVNLSFREIKYKDGTLFAKGDTAARKRSGPWEWYRKDGSLIRTGSYKLASRTGEWKWFDRDGKVTKTVNYPDKSKT